MVIKCDKLMNKSVLFTIKYLFDLSSYCVTISIIEFIDDILIQFLLQPRP